LTAVHTRSIQISFIGILAILCPAVAQQIVDAAYRVHTTLGPGSPESVYQTALAYELEKRGLRVSSEQSIPVVCL
jgi:hypothetical protein